MTQKKYNFNDIFLDDSKNISKINLKEITNIGDIAVIDQSRTYIAGYVDESNYKVCKNERIIFGDHTRIIKYVNIPFITGADGVKTLKLKDEKKCLYKFFYYYLQYLDIPNNGYSRHFKFLKEKEFTIPPIEFQKKVIENLEKIENLIKNKKMQEKKLKDLIKSQFVVMFENKNFEKILVSEAIEKKYIEKPLDGNHGSKHPKSSDYVKSGVPFIMANDMKNGYVDLINCNFITKEQADSLDKGFAKNNDVLITHKGTIGETAILHTDYEYVVLTPQITYYRTNNNYIIPEYLKFYFDSESFQVNIKKIASSGATRAYIGITEQQKLSLIIPPIELQKQFGEFVKQMDKQKEICNKTIDKLKELKKAKMQEYFGGVINE